MDFLIIAMTGLINFIALVVLLACIVYMAVLILFNLYGGGNG